MNDGTYAGDVTPTQTWMRLIENPKAKLLDVRTPAEWTYVGVPDLSTIARQIAMVPWILFPSQKPNPEFLKQVSQTEIDPSQDLYIICRSGVRSKSAAIALTEAGFKTCYNVAYGFEGDKDDSGHRGTVNGWKVEKLPWSQG